MNRRATFELIVDELLRRCETSVVWFTATVVVAAALLFGLGLAIVAVIWR